MISALIAVAMLLLGPGLAYFGPPAGLLRQSSKSVRANVNAAKSGLVRLSLEGLPMPAAVEADLPSDLAASDLTHSAGYNSDPKLWRRWAEFKGPGSSALPRVGTAGRSLRTPGFAAAPFRFPASRSGALVVVTGGAALQPSVLKAVQPWLRGGYLDGRGHGDPADNRHGTFIRDSFFSSRLDSNPSFPTFTSSPTGAKLLPFGASIVHADLGLFAPFKFKPRRIYASDIRVVHVAGAVAGTRALFCPVRQL